MKYVLGCDDTLINFIVSKELNINLLPAIWILGQQEKTNPNHELQAFDISPPTSCHQICFCPKYTFRSSFQGIVRPLSVRRLLN